MKLFIFIIYILIVCILFIGFFEVELSKEVRDKGTVIIGIFLGPIALVLLLGWAILALPVYLFNKIDKKIKKKV